MPFYPADARCLLRTGSGNSCREVTHLQPQSLLTGTTGLEAQPLYGDVMRSRYTDTLCAAVKCNGELKQKRLRKALGAVRVLYRFSGIRQRSADCPPCHQGQFQ